MPLKYPELQLPVECTNTYQRGNRSAAPSVRLETKRQHIVGQYSRCRFQRRVLDAGTQLVNPVAAVPVDIIAIEFAYLHVSINGR